MRVWQVAYVGVWSETLTPAMITERLGLVADETREKGARREDPPVPRKHSWRLNSDLPHEERIDAHLERLLERLAPASDAIKALTVSGLADVSLQFVRHFETGPEDEDVLAAREASVPEGLRVLRGQHPALGFHLSVEVLARIAALGLSIGFDEYGDECA